MRINANIQKSAAARIARIKYDLVHAGDHYPKAEVQAALDYWDIQIQ
jgi:hypothetical protein